MGPNAMGGLRLSFPGPFALGALHPPVPGVPAPSPPAGPTRSVLVDCKGEGLLEGAYGPASHKCGLLHTSPPMEAGPVPDCQGCPGGPVQRWPSLAGSRLSLASVGSVILRRGASPLVRPPASCNEYLYATRPVVGASGVVSDRWVSGRQGTRNSCKRSYTGPAGRPFFFLRTK